MTEHGMDYETWSDVNLPERGMDNYMSSPHFDALIVSVSDGETEQTFDFVFDESARYRFKDWLNDRERDGDVIIAHNAPFERLVTDTVFHNEIDLSRMQDSAVDGRAVGAESKLEVASRQLTSSHKLEVGKELVMLFCVPNDFYPTKPTRERIIENGHESKWKEFIMYCEMDARGSLEIRHTARRMLESIDPKLLEREARYELLTHEMNLNGWYVDMDLVKKMKQRHWANNIIAERAFKTEKEEHVNFNSTPQLRAFCEARGVKVKSLDKYHLPAELKKVKERIRKLETALQGEKGDYKELNRAITQLKEVESLLETKAEKGGSALSKLPKIVDLTSTRDGRLRDQYVHVGAGQTFRTAARGVQLQNIKRLDGNIRDVDTLYDFEEHWSNGDMAGQLRQVFRAEHDEGQLIVGDFSGVESRGLAYLAEEEWKLEVFREGRDVYKELYSRFTGGKVKYEDVTSEQRPRGKYSELSCGYQASGKAVQDFMFRLGFEITIEEATENVMDWRKACQNIVTFWNRLNRLLLDTVQNDMDLSINIGYGLRVRTHLFDVESVQAQHPGARSMAVQIVLPSGEPIVTRFFHGVYIITDDNDRPRICYYKPADRNTGELWKKDYAHPDLKDGNNKPLRVLYSIYGGKLAGILTQSLCREIFFESLELLYEGMKDIPNAKIIGQFHDEIVVDWKPMEGGATLEEVKSIMEKAMSTTSLRGFPLDTDIKSAFRYIK